MAVSVALAEPRTAPAHKRGAAAPDSLYANREKVYPQRVSGRFRRIKWIALAVLLAIYYIVPWIRWDRGPGAPDQAVLIDMPGRRAYFFFIEIWPQEVYYLVGLLVLGAVGLFLVTALAGRVWCGFTCPQTVWTDLFMLVERWIEGDRNQRMKLDAAPLGPAKIGKKLAKHGAWIIIAAATGGAWIFYFNDAPATAAALLTGDASAGVLGFTALFTATTYLLAGWAREQVCIYMCPWPRFQSAMFDEETCLVTYERWRGEPRGHAKRGQTFAGRGDCIDCGLCARVCPTGIDIRDGQQLACIGCALCVDACNSVMAKIGRPLELITYDSLAAQDARSRGEPVRSPRLLRPRTIAYAAMLLIVGGLMTGALASRSTLSLSVLPDRAPLFVTLSDGSIQNGYTVRILNKLREPRSFRLAVAGRPGLRLTVIGYEDQAGAATLLPVAEDSVGTFRVLVHAPRGTALRETNSFALTVSETSHGESATEETVFHAPSR